MKTYRSESTEQPLPVDETTSPTTVYARENIQEETRTDDQENESTWYTYDETQYTKEEWQKLQQEQRINALEQENQRLQEVIDTMLGQPTGGEV